MKLSTLRALHVATDALLVSAGWLAAWGIRYAMAEPIGRAINPLDWYLRALPIVVVPWIATCWWFGIYRSRRTQTAVDELSKLLRGAMLGLLVLAGGRLLLQGVPVRAARGAHERGDEPRLQGASRMFFHRLERNLRRSGSLDLRVLIVGTGVPAIRLLQKLQDHPEDGYRVVGLLDDAPELPEKDVAGVPVLGRVDDLREVAIRHGVEEIFVALPSLGHTRMLALVLGCEDLGITFRVVTNLFEVLTAGTQLDLVDDQPLVRLGLERVHPLYEPCKRVFDLVCASAASCSPRRSSRGRRLRLWRSGVSPWFVHERIGRDGKPFSDDQAAHAARGRRRLRGGAARRGRSAHHAVRALAARHEHRRAAAAVERAARRDVDRRAAARDAVRRRALRRVAAPAPRGEARDHRDSGRSSAARICRCTRTSSTTSTTSATDRSRSTRRSCCAQRARCGRAGGFLDVDVDVSICIATYRRRHGLARLLDSSRALKLPGRAARRGDRGRQRPRERPGARSGADACAPLPLRWLREPRKNIAYARNLAVANARGEWLAFVDDDEVATSAGSRRTGSTRARATPTATSARCCRGSRPGSPRGSTCRSSSARASSPARGITNTVRAPGNAFVRRSLFRDARFDPSFGRSGGEDTALFRRLTARGSRFEWVDEAIVHEYVPAGAPPARVARAPRVPPAGASTRKGSEHELGLRSLALGRGHAVAGAAVGAPARVRGGRC
jgi:hypothetical protein